MIVPAEEFEKQLDLSPEEVEAKEDFIRELFKSDGIEVHERKVNGVEQV